MKCYGALNNTQSCQQGVPLSSSPKSWALMPIEINTIKHHTCKFPFSLHLDGNCSQWEVTGSVTVFLNINLDTGRETVSVTVSRGWKRLLFVCVCVWGRSGRCWGNVCALRNQRDEPFDIMGNNFMLPDIMDGWRVHAFIASQNIINKKNPTTIVFWIWKYHPF